MRLNPLSLRVVLLSWGAALVAWPFAWLLLAAAQGLGTWAAGGGWVGVAVPLGLHPWGVVNEPTIAFAGTRAALFLYWLTPQLAVLLVASLLPTVVPVPPSWLSEVLVYQLATASAVLGLGWAPPLGIVDGPAAGLARFWNVRPTLFVGAAALAGALVVQLAVVRLNGRLWSEPGGPTRRRRLVVTLVHGLIPAGAWVLLGVAAGWSLVAEAAVTAGVVLLGAFAGAWLYVPSTPLAPRPELGWGKVSAIAVIGVLVLSAALWAGSPRAGGGRAILWGELTQTNNLRPGMEPVRLTTHPARKTPPAR